MSMYMLVFECIVCICIYCIYVYLYVCICMYCIDVHVLYLCGRDGLARFGATHPAPDRTRGERCVRARAP